MKQVFPLLVRTLSLILLPASLPALANEPPVIPVEAVQEREIPTGTVEDLSVIESRQGWQWNSTEAVDGNYGSPQRKLPESMRKSAEEVAEPTNRQETEQEWGNTGERRSGGPMIDVTQF